MARFTRRLRWRISASHVLIFTPHSLPCAAFLTLCRSAMTDRNANLNEFKHIKAPA
jgi:hypothetical protein